MDTQRGDVDAGLREGAVRIDATLYDADAASQPDRAARDDGALGRPDAHAAMRHRACRAGTARRSRCTMRHKGRVGREHGGGRGLRHRAGPRARDFTVPRRRLRLQEPSWSHVSLCAMAAKQVGRPVRLALTRPQMFGPVGGRPFTEQRAVWPRRPGRHVDGDAPRHDRHHVDVRGLDGDVRDAVADHVRGAEPRDHAPDRGAERQHAVFMRAPRRASRSNRRWTGSQLGMDPVARGTRRSIRGRRQCRATLRECYEVGARRFGWSRTGAHDARRRHMIGLGMAAAAYPANRSEASARARILPDGTAEVASGTQDIGTGTGDDAGRGRCAWFLAAERALRARRFQPAACAGIGRLTDRRRAWRRPCASRAAARAKLVMLAVAAPDRRCTASRPTT